MRILLPFVCSKCNPRDIILNLDIPPDFAMAKVLSSGNTSSWEPEVLACLCTVSSISGERSFLDIGANIGFYSLSLTLLFSDMDAVAIEPTPNLTNYIKDLSKKNNVSIQIVKKAVSQSVGNARFYITRDNSCSSLLEKPAEEIINVQTITLEELYKNKIFKIIKIDTEGTEYDVIKSGIESIKKVKPFIILEVLEKRHVTGLMNLLSEYHLYLLKKDFSILQSDEFTNPVNPREYNWLLSPVEICSDFRDVYQKWVDAIENTSFFISNSRKS